MRKIEAEIMLRCLTEKLPMETAPRDGTLILNPIAVGYTVPMRWSDEQGAWVDYAGKVEPKAWRPTPRQMVDAHNASVQQAASKSPSRPDVAQ